MERWGDPKVPQIFRIGGYAGSGKTTIIRSIVNRYPEREIIVCTFTGKAAQVLRDKGLRGAINLHQVFYTTDAAAIETVRLLEIQAREATDSWVQKDLQKKIARQKGKCLPAERRSTLT